MVCLAVLVVVELVRLRYALVDAAAPQYCRSVLGGGRDTSLGTGVEWGDRCSGMAVFRLAK